MRQICAIVRVTPMVYLINSASPVLRLDTGRGRCAGRNARHVPSRSCALARHLAGALFSAQRRSTSSLLSPLHRRSSSPLTQELPWPNHRCEAARSMRLVLRAANLRKRVNEAAEVRRVFGDPMATWPFVVLALMAACGSQVSSIPHKCH